MSTYFIDTSALVKRYLTEPGTSFVEKVADPAAANILHVSALTRVEAAAACAGRYRAGQGFTLQARDAAVARMLQDFASHYEVVATSAAILSHAVALTQLHRLRGYDAVQLATALRVQATLPAELQPLTFLSADDDLLSAAQAEGLLTDNPNHHP
ncbi:MAG: type II toxin-antitoxin system VapC family toxin [Armatimonadetes bacterium]|nr:type II toxin-antitoxin system VapC family toxin [Armatimonadota bacterium]